MIYFKKVYLNDTGEKKAVERAMRKFALKSPPSIDFSGSSHEGSGKLFLGQDGRDDIKFTRIRYLVENYLPKLIISLPKSETENYYKVRYSIMSTVFFCLLSAGFLLAIASVLMNKNRPENALIPFAFLALFILFTRVEMNFIDRDIKKAMGLAK
ncbi:hypothetical protein GCM10023149_28140 [Mucilaginibacter gynuensis]|uniref:Uncharacterized protein n=1 Tax=Mucilaginibacter gynuensis TaxID=1302236 RepID=A0ABP8GK08_9SPHI